METYEATQNALLRVIDTLKEDIDTADLAQLSGLIGLIYADPNKADLRISKAILAVCDALAKTANNRGFKYGLGLAGKAIRNLPIIEVEQ